MPLRGIGGADAVPDPRAAPAATSASRARSAAGSSASAAGTTALRMRAPWLPPITSSSIGPVVRRGIGRGRARRDGRPHRIAGLDGAHALGRVEPVDLGEGGGDARDARRQQAVGAAEHAHSARGCSVGNPEARRRQHGRHRGIAAEARPRRPARARAAAGAPRAMPSAISASADDLARQRRRRAARRGCGEIARPAGGRRRPGRAGR